jgi:hypothetical protein
MLTRALPCVLAATVQLGCTAAPTGATPFDDDAGSSPGEDDTTSETSIDPDGTGDPPAESTATTAGSDGESSSSEGDDSSSSGGDPPAPGLPAWGEGLAVNAWMEVPGTALASVPISVETGGNTGPVSKVIAWNGFAIDPRDSTVYCAAAGGHHDYAGNEVDSIRMSDDAPAWIEATPSTPWDQIVENVTHYADGRPTSRHTFYGIAFDPTHDRVMLLGGAQWGNGYMANTVDGYDVSSLTWDPAGTYPDPLPDFGAYSASAVASDPEGGDIYAFGNYGIMRLPSATPAWEQLQSGSPIVGQGAAAAFDTTRQRILLAGGDPIEHAVYDVVADSVEIIAFGGSAAGSIVADQGDAMVYVPSIDAFLLRKPDAGNSVLRIDAETFAVEPLDATGGEAIPETTNGVWKRFLYAPQIGGVLYFPTYEGNVWFLRTE